MKDSNTKQKILTEAVKLFAGDGYDAVTVEMIAEAVGIKAPSLYKHYKSKQDIFRSVLREMERRDALNAAESFVPEKSMEEAPETYEDVSVSDLLDFCRRMFRYWTEDEFASSFRKMLTVEQYRSREMNELYHQYLGSGPLGYTADILGSEEAALALYSPIHLLYSVYDSSDNKAKVSEMLESHLENWRSKYNM